MRRELFFAVRVLLKEFGRWKPYAVVRLICKETILPVSVRREASQVVVTAVKKKSAQQEVMLQRFRSVCCIGSCSTCIRKGLPDIYPWRRAVLVRGGCFLNGLADLPGACIDIRCGAPDHCDGLIDLLREVMRLNIGYQSIGLVGELPQVCACLLNVGHGLADLVGQGRVLEKHSRGA